MSYTILNSSGATITTVADSTFNTATNLQLPGPNTVGYGQKLNENLIYLLENFAASTAPGSERSIISGAPITGQLWYDTGNKVLKIYDATVGSFTPLAGVTNASYPAGTYPTPGKNGDFFYNTLTQQLFITQSGSWSLIGPQFTAQQGTSGTTLITTVDTNGGTHNVVGINSAGRLVAVLSADSTFTPQYPIDNPGVGSPTVFPTIGPGITFANTIQNIGLTATLNGNVLSPTSAVVVVNTRPATAIFTGNLSGNVNGNVYGNIFAGTITSANLNSTNIYGNVQTAAQPNITSVGTLTSLTVSGAVTFSTLPTYGGVSLATQGGSASFSKIDNTPIGTITPNIGAFTNLSSSGTVSGAGFANIFANPPGPIGSITPVAGSFTTLRSTNLDYTIIGNTSAAAGSFTALNVSGATTLNGSVTLGSSTSLTLKDISASGTISASNIVGTTSIQGTISAASASQPYVTTMANLTSAAKLASVGTITSGTWQGSNITPQYGGTGTSGTLTGIPYANGNNNWTVTSAANISAALSGTSPTLTGTNFSGIPLTALSTSPNYLINATPSFTGTATNTAGSYSLVGSAAINTGALAITAVVNIPPATGQAYGVVKVDGTTITINGTGVISAAATSTVTSLTLPGTQLNAAIVTSSLTSVGRLSSLTVGPVTVTNPPATVLTATGGISAGSFYTTNGVTATSAALGSITGSSLAVTGDVTAFYSPSDIRLKENLTPISDALEKVCQLHGYHYNYIGKNDKLVGLIAGDVLKVLPEAAYQFTPLGMDENLEDPYIAVRYELLVPLLVESVKQLTARVKELETKLK